jgi:hypothetical protein
LRRPNRRPNTPTNSGQRGQIGCPKH